MSTQSNFDVIIAGAGSLGTPTAYFLAMAGLKVLVIESRSSVGQGSNKHAIGGIRATHSDPAKILLCSRSIDIFHIGKKNTGRTLSGVQAVIALSHMTKKPKRRSRLARDAAQSRIEHRLARPGSHSLTLSRISTHRSSGGTFSQEDGSASPLKAAFAFYQEAVRAGAVFHFNEIVTAVEVTGNQVRSVTTTKGRYSTNCVINAAGAWTADIGRMVGLELPVKPDAHEAGITEAVQPMFSPMIVDIRRRPGSSNFYFYQHPGGKIIFCVTPDPQIWGYFEKDTSEFLAASG